MSKLSLKDLSPEQLQLLSRRLRKARTGKGVGGDPQVISRRPETGPCPLSFAQQRLWVLHLLDPAAAAYHIPMVAELRGPLDLPALEAALGTLIERHEALRTTFEMANGEPVQVVQPLDRFSLERIDLSHLDGSERSEALARLEDEEAAKPFDLARGPLLRASLAVLGSDRHHLLLTLHHVAADNWSVGILTQELTACYDARVAGKEPLLPALPVQYADYAVWQRQWLQGETLETQLDFWRLRLAGAPPVLELPLDHARPQVAGFRFGRHTFHLESSLAERLDDLARTRSTTLFNVLLAAWNALLHRYADVEDVVVGTPIAGRRQAEIEGLIGFFVNTLVLRNRPRSDQSFEQFLATVHEGTLEAHAHQDLPFERIVEELRPERDEILQPLFQVLFNFYDGAFPILRFSGLDVVDMRVEIGTWNDLDLMLVKAPEGLEGYLRYNADLFEESTAEALATSYQRLLEGVATDPARRLADLPLTAELVVQADAARARNARRTLALAATFTADSLGEILDFWMDRLGIESRVELAPYNQVLQQLLDPGSPLRRNRLGVDAVLLRLADFVRYRGPDAQEEPAENLDYTDPELLSAAERSADDLLGALEQAVDQLAVPGLVVLCPEPPLALQSDAFKALVENFTQRLAASLEAAPNVHLVRPEDLQRLYPSDPLHDAYTDRIAHVPYTEDGFVALGTLLARRVRALLHPPAKVVVLDCDQTLWRGVCAEDGPHGVVLDPGRRQLQELMVAQQEAGVLLCLCSKNEEPDVWATFDGREDFPLKRHHLTAARINWSAKSNNLKELAEELALGLDSFIFVDDNPVECAEVQANCPSVRVLKLDAADEGSIPRALEHFWAFDRLRVTTEDRHRTTMYRQQLKRETHRKQATSFADFLADLELAITLEPLTEESLPRVAQLTQRTNQFNASTLRRTEGEIRRLTREEGLVAWVVYVRDRFGDYGLVGVTCHRTTKTALLVDTFLLSCRVLGRGVEHRMLAALGTEALAKGLGHVEVPAVPTARNRPVFDFLQSVAGKGEEAGEGRRFRLSAEAAAELSFEVPDDAPEVPRDQALKQGFAPAVHAPDRDVLSDIATELFDPADIRRRVAERRHLAAGGASLPYEAPRSATEEHLADLFAEMLGVERVGVHDNFFQLGGHSLMGTVLLARLRDAFGIELPLLRLFQGPTVAQLAVALDESDGVATTSSPSAPDIVPTTESPEVNVEELSDAEVHDMLESLLAAKR